VVETIELYELVAFVDFVLEVVYYIVAYKIVVQVNNISVVVVVGKTECIDLCYVVKIFLVSV
jgi:hypothetical protein